MNIANQILAIRKQENLSQEEFGKLFSVSKQTVESWEKGKRYPKLHILIEISERFGLSLDALIKEDSKMVESIDWERGIKRIKFKGFSVNYWIGAGIGVLTTSLFFPEMTFRGVMLMAGVLLIGIGCKKRI